MGHQDAKPRQLLTSIWAAQRIHNQRIRADLTPPETANPSVYWNKHYLLGLISEVDEVLREIQWKVHRKQPVLQHKRNLAMELSDLTKYVLSLWEHNEFSLQQMLEYTYEKTDEVATRYHMEHTEIPPSQPIVITDIDGTLGDYRAGLLRYLRNEYGILTEVEDQVLSLTFDSDMDIPFPTYFPLKEKFEADGEYAYLPAFEDAFHLLYELKTQLDQPYALIAYTARPAGRYKHIWQDTYSWLKMHFVEPTQLFMGAEDRVLTAVQYRKAGNPVIMLEDNPVLVRRASSAGIPTIVRQHPYNAHTVEYPLVHRFTDFREALPLCIELLSKGGNSGE